MELVLRRSVFSFLVFATLTFCCGTSVVAGESRTEQHQAERFAIIRVPFESYPNCGPDNFRIVNIFRKLANYERQLVYLQIAFPAHSLFCSDARFSYKPITLLKGKLECPDYFGIVAPGGFDAREIPCRAVKRAGIWFGVEDDIKRRMKSFRHIRLLGGLYFHGADIGLIVPASAGHYWKVTDDPQEGIFEDAYVGAVGLVRVHARYAEETIALYFEPVDPDAVGLTWKFDNTVDAARRGAQTLTLDTQLE